MLMPHVRTVAAALHAYRSAWTGLLRDPASPHSYRRLDDAAYTLCVLMGQRNAADAAAKAERFLARAEPAADGSVREKTGVRQAVHRVLPSAVSGTRKGRDAVAD
ncbi:DUF5133 domain-containing protein [Streptomyces sp. 4N124]|uniref:DUF5133 domain-containing protein n=1 Tax=Streptomyces sp. 4N124 TaxID=3457420 RepID=UPI003FD0D0A1